MPCFFFFCSLSLLWFSFVLLLVVLFLGVPYIIDDFTHHKDHRVLDVKALDSISFTNKARKAQFYILLQLAEAR